MHELAFLLLDNEYNMYMKIFFKLINYVVLNYKIIQLLYFLLKINNKQ